MKKQYNGSCLCGKVTFQIIGEFENFFFCHCSRCRMTSGSAHGANLFSKTAKLTFQKGSEYIKDFQVESTRFVTTFCTECGSKLPKNHNGKIIQVPAGAISSDIDITPNAHIFYGSRANWDNDLHCIQKFEDAIVRS